MIKLQESKIIDEKKQKKFVPEEKLLETMKDEFKWALLQKKDQQAAYLCGLYLQLVDYQQRDILKTRGLQKKLRYLFSNLSKEKLLKIFEACNQVLIAVQDKTRSKFLRYSRIRSALEEFLTAADWKSPPEELSLAFMTGYDLYWREYRKLFPQEKKFEDVKEGEDVE